MYQISCRHFRGDRPCGKSSVCSSSCPSKDLIETRILLIHLGAIGAVVRSTGLLAPLRRRHPRAHLTWVTDAPSHHLLNQHPMVDRVLTTQEADLLQLSALEFDVAYVVDKSLKAAGVLRRTRADMVKGFFADDRTGAILPANSEAQELWEIGLDDQRKFFVNQKTENQLVIEALGLGPWQGDRPSLPLTGVEQELRLERRRLWSEGGRKLIVGLNTGCSSTIPAKKLSVEKHRELLHLIAREEPQWSPVLLGGPEDEERNRQISEGLGVVSSPTTRGLRDGLVSVASCDLILTGDSLGLHMAVSQGIWTVAWFGPTCAHEIELFGQGEKILSPVPCAPCWKRSCQKDLMCYDQVDARGLLEALRRGVQQCRIQGLVEESCLSKPPFLETSSSPSLS